MTATQTKPPARRTGGRVLKIAGAAFAILFAIGLVGSCGKPADSAVAPTQAPAVVVATATTQPPPTVRPMDEPAAARPRSATSDVPKPTAAPPTQAPQPTAVPAKPTQAPAPTAAPAKPAAVTKGIAAKAGACPTDHPIKGNAGSMIYHRPGGASYTRTQAEECFDTAGSAQAAGYRAAER